MKKLIISTCYFVIHALHFNSIEIGRKAFWDYYTDDDIYLEDYAE